MIEPTEDTLKALVNLENNEDFKRFMEWLDASLTHHLREIPALHAPLTEKCQGYALALMDVVDRSRTPRKALDRMQQMKNRKPTA